MPDKAVLKTGARGDALTATRFETQMLTCEPTAGFWWGDYRSPEMFKTTAGLTLTATGNQSILHGLPPFAGTEGCVVALAASAAGVVLLQTMLPVEFAPSKDQLELWVAVALQATQVATNLTCQLSAMKIGDTNATAIDSIVKQAVVTSWDSDNTSSDVQWLRYNLSGNGLTGGSLVSARLTRESTTAHMIITGAVFRARRHFNHPDRLYR